MQKIKTVRELHSAIVALEADRDAKWQDLKDQAAYTVESLKPANLLKMVAQDFGSMPFLMNDIIGTVVGLASGFVSRKVFVGSSKNIFRNLIGSVLQFGVTWLIAKNSAAIKSFGQSVIRLLFAGSEEESKEEATPESASNPSSL